MRLASARGAPVTVRKTKGRDIEAACGQLSADGKTPASRGCRGLKFGEVRVAGDSSKETLSRQLEAIDPDVRLMLQVKEDVQGAFETLVQRYQDRLLGVILHLVGNPTEAEDLTQDVFLRVYKARKGYHPRAKFSTWLFTVANNLVSNHNRSKRRNKQVSLDAMGKTGSQALPAAERVVSAEGTPSAQMRKAELSDVVREALERLGEDQKVAVLLNKFEEMRYAEIAEIMGKSEAAVKSLLSRARNNLREVLEPYLRTGDRAGVLPPPSKRAPLRDDGA